MYLPGWLCAEGGSGVKGLRDQLVGAALVVLTVTAVICAGYNYQQQERYRLPEDGAAWMDVDTPAGRRVIAAHVEDGGPADRGGIRKGDHLLSISWRLNTRGVTVRQATDVMRVLMRIGAWAEAKYTLERNGTEIPATVIVADAYRDRALYLQYAVGSIYLSIGLFLWFRRNRAPKSQHFYWLCLASFVLFSFHYTGKLNEFDTAIYLGNLAAGWLVPALFLHFCRTFPEAPKPWGTLQLASIYTPAVSLIVVQVLVAAGIIRTAMPYNEMRWVLDRLWLLLFCLAFLAGAGLLHLSYRRELDSITRQQLKWLRNGTLAGIVPFAAFYATPFVLGGVPSPEMRLAVLFLGLIPLTWAYAILRYRLMDVDIIFQQGYVYVLATLSVLGVVSLLVYALAQRDGLSPTAVTLLVLVAAFVFEPLRNWIQQILDRYVFYRNRWDYRQTLIAFARELSSEMDLSHSLTSVGDRLIRTLSVSHVGFFLADESGSFRLHSMVDKNGVRGQFGPDEVDLSFLAASVGRPYLFFERTRGGFDVLTREMSQAVRATIARLDLTYYLPCVFRGRTVAWLGVSRASNGDFLSSDDVDLLATLAGYVGMAVENARLYRSLADKAEQYERLKEFSENIVESVNVGIIALDLEDRVESWNSEIERLTGVPRQYALGRSLDEVLAADFMVHCNSVKGSRKIHQMYKVRFGTTRLAASATQTHPLNGSGASANGASTNGSSPAAPPETVVNVAIAPLVTRDGLQIGRLIVLNDVTERNELERRLVQADKLSSIGLLAAGVAHEVNTPLAVISTYAQMLAKQVGGDETKSRLLDKIAKQTFRASEIVNSLLNFSRTSSTEFEPVQINRVVRETLNLLEPQMEKSGISITAELEDDLPPIRGNAGRLQQVFLNLFLNARDAMEGGGRLVIRTLAAGDAVQIEVQDTGPGIPPELLSRIFDPFFTTKTVKKGTGLGLSVTYGIVEEHGGRIEALPQDGPGALFRLEFPALRKAVNAGSTD